ncbi:hypothetical protein B6U81_07475 [Thermoplasmatales archaeon ex4484_30]|nr:MAG: hypothetical protein B6U81_07475 [Thermoplasmatales archaeon ex4484_30]
MHSYASDSLIHSGIFIKGIDGISAPEAIFFISLLQIGQIFSIRVMYDFYINIVEFGEIVKICKALEACSGRKDKKSILKKFILSLKENETEAGINFLIGNIPKINIGWGILRRKKMQSPLSPISKEISTLYNRLLEAGEIKGEDARRKREAIIFSIINQLNKEERDCFIRSIMGEMRHGVSDGLILETISEIWGIEKDKIEKAYMLAPLSKIVISAKKNKRKNKLEDIKIRLYDPIKPMMAESATIKEIAGKRHALEYKFDGIRVQIHVGKEIKIFSRNLREITHYLPEIVGEAKEIEKNVILDGEIIAFSLHPLPFQELMKKFRVRNRIDIRTKLFVFDILYRKNKSLLDLEYRERWKLLKDVAPQYIPPHIEAVNEREIKEFFQKAIKDGHEGIVAKDLKSKYRLHGGWYKIKKSYSLDMTIIAAEWGHGRRHRWLSDYWLAVKGMKGFHMVGKTFKGLTDKEFEEMTEELLKWKIKEEGRVVFVKPSIVVEVEFNDIQKSKKYGYALRFARISRIRWDKEVDEINTIEDVARVYEILRRR